MRTRVGLAGGIGSGKSTVGKLLAELGAVVIDYDLLAREVVTPGAPALVAIEERFGPSVIRSDGKLDRPALAAIVFSEDKARRDLEKITHPAVRALAADRERAVPADAVVVHENPLLVEMGLHGSCDLVVVVDAPVEDRVARLRARGMSETDARARIATQLDAAVRNSVADVVIDNSGSEADLAAAAKELWVSRLA